MPGSIAGMHISQLFTYMTRMPAGTLDQGLHTGTGQQHAPAGGIRTWKYMRMLSFLQDETWKGLSFSGL